MRYRAWSTTLHFYIYSGVTRYGASKDTAMPFIRSSSLPALFARAGLRLEGVTPTATGLCVLEAVPA